MNIFPKKKKLNIIYEDQNFLIINKDLTIVIHPEKNENLYFTYINILCYYYPYIKFLYRYGVVHRLDKTTTGLIIFAKNTKFQYYLLKLFKKKKIIKHYIAYVLSNTNNSQLLITFIKRKEKKYVVDLYSGKLSKTKIIFIKKIIENIFLVSIIIYTGRTHQIRCHLNYLKCPILFDYLYGFKNSLIKKKNYYNNKNIFLHCNFICFKYFNIIFKQFIDIPKYFI